MHPQLSEINMDQKEFESAAVTQRQIHGSHAAAPGSIPGRVDRCQPRILRNLASYRFIAVILVLKANKSLGIDVLNIRHP